MSKDFTNEDVQVFLNLFQIKDDEHDVRQRRRVLCSAYMNNKNSLYKANCHEDYFVNSDFLDDYLFSIQDGFLNKSQYERFLKEVTIVISSFKDINSKNINNGEAYINEMLPNWINGYKRDFFKREYLKSGFTSDIGDLYLSGKAVDLDEFLNKNKKRLNAREKTELIFLIGGYFKEDCFDVFIKHDFFKHHELKHIFFLSNGVGLLAVDNRLSYLLKNKDFFKEKIFGNFNDLYLKAPESACRYICHSISNGYGHEGKLLNFFIETYKISDLKHLSYILCELTTHSVFLKKSEIKKAIKLVNNNTSLPLHCGEFKVKNKNYSSRQAIDYLLNISKTFPQLKDIFNDFMPQYPHVIGPNVLEFFKKDKGDYLYIQENYNKLNEKDAFYGFLVKNFFYSLRYSKVFGQEAVDTVKALKLTNEKYLKHTGDDNELFLFLSHLCRRTISSNYCYYETVDYLLDAFKDKKFLLKINSATDNNHSYDIEIPNKLFCLLCLMDLNNKEKMSALLEDDLFIKEIISTGMIDKILEGSFAKDNIKELLRDKMRDNLLSELNIHKNQNSSKSKFKI